MDTVTVPMTVPKGALPYLDESDSQQMFSRAAMMLYPLIKETVISHGRAAEILGVHKTDLIEFYCKMGIPYLNQSRDELEEELQVFDASTNGGSKGKLPINIPKLTAVRTFSD